MIDSKGKGKMAEKSEAVVDRKGKGIMVGNKGKGKMVEGYEDDYEVEEDGTDDDDDDDTDDSDFSYGPGVDGEDSDDAEEDLLAEVDLGNIVPSRTRRGGGGSGVRISGEEDKGNSS